MGRHPTAATVVDLARTLCPGDGALHALVEHAVRDPADFVAAHADLLADRGIDAPVPNLALLALIDALIERGLATELDWREDPQEVLAQVFELATLPSRAEVADVDEPELDDDAECLDALKLADEALRSRGVLVVVIDIRSDSYPTILVDAAAFTAIEEVARNSRISLARVSVDPHAPR